MGSTNKTENLKLNSWIGSDRPERVDFNYDNEIIDKTLFEHIDNSAIHITSAERELWNNHIFMGMYFGDGAVERTITTSCPFNASFGIVFANNRPLKIINFSDSRSYNYAGFFGKQANSMGVKLASSKRGIIVNQSAAAVSSNEYANMNETGVTYNYVMFR